MTKEKKAPELREFWIFQTGFHDGNGNSEAILFDEPRDKTVHVVEKRALTEALQKLEAAEKELKNARWAKKIVWEQAEIQKKRIIELESRCAKLVAALEETKSLWKQVSGKGASQASEALDIIRRAIEEAN